MPKTADKEDASFDNFSIPFAQMGKVACAKTDIKPNLFQSEKEPSLQVIPKLQKHKPFDSLEEEKEPHINELRNSVHSLEESKPLRSGNNFLINGSFFDQSPE
jgi:hypothetical protein